MASTAKSGVSPGDAVSVVHSATGGDAFDLAYAADMVKGHEDMAALLARAARESKDADVRMFATDTLAAVHMHHQLAVDLQQTEMAEATE